MDVMKKMKKMEKWVPPAPSPTLTDAPAVGGNVNQYGIERPDFFSPYDTAANKMNPDFLMGDPTNIGAQNVSFTGPNLGGMEGFQAMQDRALSTEESPWLAMQKQANQQNMMRDLDAMAMQQSGAQADARSQLAMRGGMSTGARERLAQGGARDALRASQDIYGQRSAQDLGAGISDDQTKMALLGKTAGIEADIGKFSSAGALDASKTNAANTLKSDMFNTTAGMNADQFNIGNKLGSVDKSNLNKMGVYSEDMKAWASEQMADAMGQGGGAPGGFGGIPGLDGAGPLSNFDNLFGGGMGLPKTSTPSFFGKTGAGSWGSGDLIAGMGGGGGSFGGLF